MAEFGEKFRKERERRGLTFDDVSNVTKINSRMLKAIEAEHFDQLPGGVFNKGFVRAYAKHLGFNDEEAITEYLAVLREAQIGAQTAEWQPAHRPEARAGIEQRSEVPPPKSPSAARKSAEFATKPRIVEAAPEIEQRPERAQWLAGKLHASGFRAANATPSDGLLAGISWKIPAIVLAITLVVAAFWGRHYRNARADSASPPAETSARAVPPGGASAEPTPTPKDPKAGGAASVSIASSPQASSPSPTTRPNPSAGAQSATASATQPKAPEDNEVTVRHPVSHAAAEAAKVPTTLTLVIRATETSWISVAADGQVVSQETLIAPAHSSARASHEIVVKAGNAAGVSFLLNGKEIPAQGDEGEVRTYVFDSTGMRTSAPGQAAGNDR